MTKRPRDVRALLGVRVLNQLGAYVLPFLAVLAGRGLAAWALGAFGVAALVSRCLGGLLLDRLPPRTVIVLGLAATGGAMLLLAVARGPTQVLIAVTLVGLAFEIYEPATQESLARLTTRPGAEGAQADVYGLLGTSLVAAGSVGGLVAAFLLPLGVRWLVVADALTCLLAAGAALTLLAPDQPARRPADPPGETPASPGTQTPDPGPQGPGSDERGAHRSLPPEPHASKTSASRGGWFRLLGRRGPKAWRPPGELVRLTVAGTAFACGSLVVLMFVPFVLLQRGAPEWLPGLMLTGAALLAPVTGHAGRRALRRLGHEHVLAIGTAALGFLAFAMAIGRSVPLMVAGYLSWAAVDSVLQGRWPAMIAEAAPEADRPRWFAFHGSSWGIAQPAVPGLVALAGGAAGGAMATAGGAFLLVPAVLVAHRRRGRRVGGVGGGLSGGRSPPGRAGEHRADHEQAVAEEPVQGHLAGHGRAAPEPEQHMLRASTRKSSSSRSAAANASTRSTPIGRWCRGGRVPTSHCSAALVGCPCGAGRALVPAPRAGGGAGGRGASALLGRVAWALPGRVRGRPGGPSGRRRCGWGGTRGGR